MTHEIVVGNIGAVYSGEDEREANRKYETYVAQSEGGYGRASGEPVTWFIDGEIHKDYRGV